MARPETPNRLEARRNAETHFGGSVRALLLPLSGRAATGGRELGARGAGRRGRAGGDRRAGQGEGCVGGPFMRSLRLEKRVLSWEGEKYVYVRQASDQFGTHLLLTTHYLTYYSTALVTDSSSSHSLLPAILGLMLLTCR
jgi:hypothetical protein